MNERANNLWDYSKLARHDGHTAMEEFALVASSVTWPAYDKRLILYPPLDGIGGAAAGSQSFFRLDLSSLPCSTGLQWCPHNILWMNKGSGGS